MVNRQNAGSLAGNGARGVQVQDLAKVVADQEAAAAPEAGRLTEEDLREQAKALGLSVQRTGRRGGFRPQVDNNGNVRHTISLSLAVRKGLEQACQELDCSYSAMVEKALAHYFSALGLHFEGVPAVAAEAPEE